MQRLAETLNRSERLGRLITFVSGYLANYRGLPILLGIGFTLLSLLLQLSGFLLGVFSLVIAGVIILHLGIIVAYVGILLAEPLGKG